jgi:hypothetical protein
MVENTREGEEAEGAVRFVIGIRAAVKTDPSKLSSKGIIVGSRKNLTLNGLLVNACRNDRLTTVWKLKGLVKICAKKTPLH